VADVFATAAFLIFSECPGELWGQDCAQTCQCLNNGKCNKETGVCECAAGFVGTLCADRK